MALTHKGIGVKWGVAGTTYTATGYTLGQTVSGRSLSQSSEMEEHKDELGETKGATFFNHSKEVGLDFYFSGATITAARTNAAVLPVPGTKVTITDANDALVAGDYVVISSDRTESNASKAVGKYTIKRWDSLADYNTVT